MSYFACLASGRDEFYQSRSFENFKGKNLTEKGPVEAGYLSANRMLYVYFCCQ